MVREVLEREQAAILVGEGDDLLGEAALVKGVAAVAGDVAVAAGEERVLEHVAGAGRVAVDEIRFRGVRVAVQGDGRSLPRPGDDLSAHGP